METKATLILKNGTIQTMVGDETAQAVAVCGSEIIYVGDDAGAEAFAGEDTKVIDLEGKYVSPGFIDGHTHEVMYLIDEDTTFFFETVEPKLEVYKEAFAKFVAERPDNEMYYGNSLDMNAFPEGFVTNDWITEICPDKPVCITDMSQHCFLMNAKALEMAGIDRNTPVPDGANIFKHSDGEPTGFVADAMAFMGKLPARERTQKKYHDAFLKFQDTCNSYGITAVDIAGPTIPAEQAWEVFHDMEEAGELKVRVNCTIMSFTEAVVNKERGREYVKLLDEGQKYNSDFQRVSQAKGIIDGVPEAKSARLMEPYAPEAGEAADYIGPVYIDPEDLKGFTEVVNGAGYQVQIHAMGDGGVHYALDAYEHSWKVNGEGDYRNMIAHVTLIKPEDVKRMAELKVIGTMQPLWWYYDPNFSPLEEQNFGTERFKTEYHIREMMDAGIMITGSMDYPVQPDYRPLAGIQVGATQSSPYPGQCDDPAYVRNADQAVTAREMLECYTTNGAFEMKMEDLIGTIEVGKKADMVVLEQNILDCPVKTISETKICCTIMNGEVVYEG
ncbi:MAG: amidohydrolase [Clostridia bacterium]|nr:amidohydrolase [Clostridia bacterium]